MGDRRQPTLIASIPPHAQSGIASAARLPVEHTHASLFFPRRPLRHAARSPTLHLDTPRSAFAASSRTSTRSSVLLPCLRSLPSHETPCIFPILPCNDHPQLLPSPWAAPSCLLLRWQLSLCSPWSAPTFQPAGLTIRARPAPRAAPVRHIPSARAFQPTQPLTGPLCRVWPVWRWCILPRRLRPAVLAHARLVRARAGVRFQQVQNRRAQRRH